VADNVRPVKVFVDVGAHDGETLAIAQEPRWGFDRIHCFEPAPSCWSRLETVADERTTIHRFGLWDTDARLTLHDPGTIGGSVFGEQTDSMPTVEISVCDAGAWFDTNLDGRDEIVVKINAEGAECVILNRLLETDQIGKLAELLVHFDVRKFPSLRHQEHPTRALLAQSGVDYRSADEIFFGRTFRAKTVNWLQWYHATGVRRLWFARVRQATFAVRVRVYRIRRWARGGRPIASRSGTAG
jgi:FkbM family methyltransferase